MKRKILTISVIIVLFVICAFLTIGFNNKTFLKDYYGVNKLNSETVKIPIPLFSYYLKEKKSENWYTATFNTLKDVNKVRDVLNNYIENLQSCYDESIFYDKDIDISIYKYSIIDNFPFNKIFLDYDFGNQCANEYVLNDDWITDIISNENVMESEIDKYVIKNNEISTTNKKIENADIKDIFNYTSKNGMRIENTQNINADEKDIYYIISVYYDINILSIFIYNDEYLAFKLTDANDHSKNAIYSVDNAKQLFTSIYDKY